MNCPFCGAKNSVVNGRCSLCNNLLAPVERQEGDFEQHIRLDALSQQIRWGQVFTIILACALFLIPAIVTSDLYFTPGEVNLSRREFSTVMANYNSSREFWNSKKDQLLLSLNSDRDGTSSRTYQFDGIPLEIIIAYLVDNLGFDPSKFDDAALFPILGTPQPLMILSKYEKGTWPLQVVDSLEITLRTTDYGIVPEFVRLRRGSRDVAREQAWIYFGPELESLRNAEKYSKGMERLRFNKGSSSAFTSASYPLRLSWEYQIAPGHSE